MIISIAKFPLGKNIPTSTPRIILLQSTRFTSHNRAQARSPKREREFLSHGAGAALALSERQEPRPKTSTDHKLKGRSKQLNPAFDPVHTTVLTARRWGCLCLCPMPC